MVFDVKGDRSFAIEKAPGARDLLARIRKYRGRLPADLEFDRAMRIAERHGQSIHDALIASATLLADCRILYSEDMQDGQAIERRLTIRDPLAIA